MDLVELGLIYDVGVHDEGRHVDVAFSLTSPMCPVGDLIQEQVETATLSIEGVETVNAQLTFDPMWHPETMSPAAKLFFGRSQIVTGFPEPAHPAEEAAFRFLLAC